MLDFEELDYRATPLGELSLRRRRDPRLDGEEVYEVKLGDEFLMSSAFTAGEVALADLALADLPRGPLDVLVGGLGLGYTAAAVLRNEAVRSLLVVEYLEGVIAWHRSGLVPLHPALTTDPRCRLAQGDFFELARDSKTGFDAEAPGRRYDAVLVDIDHSPRHLLSPRSSSFYDSGGLKNVAVGLKPGGVFGLWSNDPPDAGFERVLDTVFRERQSHVIMFDNPYTGGESASTVYVARAAG